MTQHDQHRHERYGCIVSFCIAAHQYKDRRHKVDDQHEPEDAAVNTFGSWFEINCFFRNIGIPDQHELREPQVSPEDMIRTQFVLKEKWRPYIDRYC